MSTVENKSEEQLLTVPVQPSSGLNQTEVQELVAFIMGDESKPPESLDRMMTNLYDKMVMVLGYNVVANCSRQAKLQKFITTAEDTLYDVTRIPMMEHEELEKAYTSASKTMTDMTELQRRFVAQNKDVLTRTRTEQEKIAQSIMSLPADKIDMILSIIKGESEMAKSGDSFDEVDASDL